MIRLIKIVLIFTLVTHVVRATFTENTMMQRLTDLEKKFADQQGVVALASVFIKGWGTSLAGPLGADDPMNEVFKAPVRDLPDDSPVRKFLMDDANKTAAASTPTPIKSVPGHETNAYGAWNGPTPPPGPDKWRRSPGDPSGAWEKDYEAMPDKYKVMRNGHWARINPTPAGGTQ
jgi:hypothetical protein